jgi:hypothetical protein
MSKKTTLKQFEKSGWRFPNGLNSFEKKEYLKVWSTGKFPKHMKVKIDKDFEATSAMARVLGYGKISFIARKTRRSPFYAVLKLVK